MKSQRGGFFLGMIVGLLIGLALALGVALYVTKVPLPFVDKVPQRTAEQDAAEAEHNKNWDPNSPLYGNNPAKPKPVPKPIVEDVATDPANAASAPASPASAKPAPAEPAKPASAPASAASSVRNPAAILSGSEPVSTNPAADALSFYVQAGAYGSSAEAEQQRAKLSMLGLEARISEREVNGRTMYRVRLGPFAQRELAEEVRVKLSGSGIDTALVRVQK
ncbi:MAG TPA: SPOR domain-containing protein [Candidatus Aquabacterium excrementipullorum]|nr:SPOR domain-containing protein [Candidatus Aquabacterium excrementipullorum]